MDAVTMQLLVAAADSEQRANATRSAAECEVGCVLGRAAFSHFFLRVWDGGTLAQASSERFAQVIGRLEGAQAELDRRCRGRQVQIHTIVPMCSHTSCGQVAQQGRARALAVCRRLRAGQGRLGSGLGCVRDKARQGAAVVALVAEQCPVP